MNTSAQRYAAASARFTALVAAMPAPAWKVPSMCEGWSAAEVLAHVVSTETDFMAQRGLPVAPTDGLSPSAAWPVARAAMQAALDDQATADIAFDGYFGPTTVGVTIDRFYTLDLILHRWDIAAACGLAEHAVLDAGEIEMVRSNLAGLEEVMRMPGLFGAEVAVPAGADEQTKLLAYVGRSAH
ncbi:MAG: maleylpyruvate isomerase family mycothiol-dependent enzyme [Ilumatobacteraceae bacterium]